MSVAMPAIAERRYAGAIVRAIAFFIDAIALLLLNTAINTVVRRADVSAFADAAYFVLLWSAPLGGQTLGMRLVGIRLTTVDGHPPSLIAAVIRFIGLVLGAVFGFLGLIWIVFDRRKQGWHDLIAGTYVIHLDDTAGQPVSGAPFDFTAASGTDLIFCPRCGTEQRRAVYCAACGADMALGPIERRAGITYVLNQLADWERAHVIDATGRSRLEPFLRAQLGALVGAASQPAAERAHVVDERVESAAIPRAVDARPAPPRSFEIFADAFKTFAVDETPSLFLYVGAFLVVVSALIFVNVSGEQISDTTRLALVLLGTIAFLVAGLALHRVPRVLPAARTFLAIGALLVPADILAGYALVLRRPPLDAPTLWLAGSLLAALLYAALAVRGYGAWYAPLFVVALISAVGAFDVQLHLSAGWTIASYAILALALLLTGDRLPFALAPLAKPLPRAAQILAASIAVFAALSYPSIDASAGNERWAPVATALALTAFAAASGWRARVWAGWAALGGAGLTALLAVHALRPPLEWYGVALAALSWTYAALGFRTAPGTSTRFQALSLATTAAALSLTPIASYERAPFAGVLVFGAIGLLALAVPRDAQPRFRLPRTEFDQPLLYLALLSAHLVWRYAVMAAVSSFRAYDPRDLAYAWFPLAVAILAASGAPWRATRARAASLAVAGVTSAAVVTLASIGDAGANALFAASFAAIVAALAITAGVTRALWIAASFAAFAALGLLRWAAIPHEWWTLLLSTIAIAAGAVAAIVDLGRFRRIAQELALAWQALSAAVGFWFVVAGTRGSRLPVDELVWQTAAVSLLVLAALVWLESRRGGEGLEALGASAAVVAVLLMEIARLHPSELQAYSIPLGLYLLAVAIVAPQVPRLRPSAASLEIAGATALQVPALVRSAETDGEPHLVIALVASLAVLYLGTKARRPMLVRAAAVGIALGGVSATHQPGALSVYALVAAAAAIAFALVPHIDIGEREREFLEGAGAIAALAPLAAGAVSTPNAVYVVTFVAVAVVLFASGACCGRRGRCSRHARDRAAGIVRVAGRRRRDGPADPRAVHRGALAESPATRDDHRRGARRCLRDDGAALRACVRGRRSAAGRGFHRCGDRGQRRRPDLRTGSAPGVLAHSCRDRDASRARRAAHARRPFRAWRRRTRGAIALDAAAASSATAPARPRPRRRGRVRAVRADLRS
jgi:uncharacterized RDD family membrane protein YckC